MSKVNKYIDYIDNQTIYNKIFDQAGGLKEGETDYPTVPANFKFNYALVEENIHYIVGKGDDEALSKLTGGTDFYGIDTNGRVVDVACVTQIVNMLLSLGEEYDSEEDAPVYTVTPDYIIKYKKGEKYIDEDGDVVTMTAMDALEKCTK